MAVADPHPELVGHPREQRLREILDIFHIGDESHLPDPPVFECDCDWGTKYRYKSGYKNDSVAILDGHWECPFCRGYIGGGPHQ